MADNRLAEGPGVTWSRVQDDFYVASRGGDFLGFVDREADGTFVASDLHAQRVGSFSTLDEATRALVAALASVAHGGEGS